MTAHHDDEAVGEGADAEQGRLTQQGLGAERRAVLLRQRLEQILRNTKKGVKKTHLVYNRLVEIRILNSQQNRLSQNQ